MTGAEFEAVEKETTLWNGLVLTDNAALNMQNIVRAKNAMAQFLTSTDGSRYVLFKPSKPLTNDNFVTPTNDDGNGEAKEILISDIIDAVQAVSDESGMSVLGLLSVL